jgi:hypothetical protein
VARPHLVRGPDRPLPTSYPPLSPQPLPQALGATVEAIGRFQAAGVAWYRPADYYAEMVKSDEHMAKVKDRLMYEQQQIEEADER